MAELSIGIDLGTTYSCVAVYRNRAIEVIADGQGHRTTPSYVAFTTTGRLVGFAAKQQATTNPKNTIFDIKRLIGRKFRDAAVTGDLHNWPFKVIQEDGNPKVQVESRGVVETYWAEEISAMILGHLKQAAERYLDVVIKKAVVTVPAYFSDAQRQATKDAGLIAGLDVIRIINEPTAAAIAYGFNKDGMDKVVLVFDMGGGTLDVSILKIDDGVFEVLSTSGDTHLGGEDLTHTLVAHFAKEFKTLHQKDVTINERALGRLRKSCEELKQQLSYDLEATVIIDALMDGENFDLNMSRARFEHLNEETFHRILKPVEDALEGAKLTAELITDVLLIGGSTRLPKIRFILENMFPGKLNHQMNPDEAVAVGAAYQSARLCSEGRLDNNDDDAAKETAEEEQKEHVEKDENGERNDDDDNEKLREFVLLDVTPLSLGIETKFGQMSVVIPRNTSVPVDRTKVFNTAVDNQVNVHVKVFEGERPLTEENLLLGEFRVENLTPAKAREKEIEVKFAVDTNGILNVSAVEKSSQSKEFTKVITRNLSRHTKEEIDRMVQRAEEMRLEDDKEVERIRCKIALEKYCLTLQTLFQCSEVKKYVTDEERDTCMTKSLEFLGWLHKNGEATEKEYHVQYRAIHDECDYIRRKLYVKGNQCVADDDEVPLDQPT